MHYFSGKGCSESLESMHYCIGILKICNLLNVTPDYLLLGSMHAYNIPQDIIDKLRLCNQSDIELAGDFIELLVKRNNKATHNEPKL